MNATNPAVHEYTLPAYWASYLINGDDSGTSLEDLKACDQFIADNNLIRSRFCDCSEQFFSSRCDAPNQLAGDRCMFTYLTHKL